jgi:hypothetical protein
LTAGLPDGLFSNRKTQLGSILEGLVNENAYIFYDHLDYFMAIWYKLWPFGVVCGHLVYFLYFWSKKNQATLIDRLTRLGELENSGQILLKLQKCWNTFGMLFHVKICALTL